MKLKNLFQCQILFLIFILNSFYSTSALLCHAEVGGVCYFIGDEKLKYGDAEMNCFVNKGRLAIVDNREAKDAVDSALKKKGIEEAFIGLTDRAQIGKYRWINDKVLENEGEIENGSWQPPPNTGSCIVQHTSNSKWLRSKCEEKKSFVCQSSSNYILESPVRAWTSWLTLKHEDGDQILTVENLRKIYPELCPNPIDVQCRMKQTGILGESVSNVLSMPCSVNGLICLNSAQKDNEKCQQYEIRFLCPKEINECKTEGLAKCDSNAKCINTFGSYKCVCNIGFSGDGRTCVRTAKCKAWGDPHYVSFDGVVHHFMGTCQYRLVETCFQGTTTKLTPFQIYQANEHRGRNMRVSFAKSVTLEVNGSTFEIRRDNKLLIDGVEVNPPQKRQIGEIEVAAEYTTKGIYLTTSFGVGVLYDGLSRITVYAPRSYENNVCGMCGNMDGNKENEWLLSDGSSNEDPTVWGNSWMSKTQKDDNCGKLNASLPNNMCDSASHRIVTAKCDILTNINGPFSQCHGLVNPQTIYPSCYFDMCSDSENSALLCRAYEAYADKCAEEGVLLNWRSATNCNVKCDVHQHYEYQTSGCQSSCDKPNAEEDCPLPDTSGCVCDDGYLRSGSQCKPKEQCGCYDSRNNYRVIDDVWFTNKCTTKNRCSGTNEIVEDNHVQCHEYGECFQLPGKADDFECRCKKGFEGRADNCTDIDECSLGSHTCSEDGTCVNTNGNYQCKCKSGFKGDGFKCQDVNECTEGTAKCSSYATCHNTHGSYKCICSNGYEGDGKSCSEKAITVNTDEEMGCSFHKEASCHELADCDDLPSTPGFKCSCPEGATGDGMKGASHTGCKYPECPANSFGYQGYCYKFIDESNTQSVSEKQCQNLGGHLATFKDAIALNFIREKIEIFNRNKALYVGYSNSKYKDTYLSVDYSAIKTTNWAPKHPVSSQSCVVILPPGSSNELKYKSVDCDEKYESICKFPSSALLSCPDGWSKINDKCVLVVKKPTDAPEAAIDCAKFGGDLLSVVNGNQSSLIFDRVLKLEEGEFWIGLNKNLLTRSRNLVWNGGEKEIGEVAGFNNFVESIEKIVSMGDAECFKIQANGKWTPSDCSSKIEGYVCQRPLNVLDRCSPTSVYFNGKCYRMPNVNTSQVIMQNLCSAAGGNLVSIETVAEQRFVEDYLRNIERYKTHWIGLKEDEKISKKYSWQDGSFYEYNNWNDGEPGLNEAGNCVVGEVELAIKPMRWVEKKCDDKFDGLCEYLNTPCTKHTDCHRSGGECHLGQCRCKSGYQGDGLSRCDNINECETLKMPICGTNEECVDTEGSYLCNCMQNYIRSRNGGQCQDQLYCLGNADCANNAKCYLNKCECNQGYAGDGKSSCRDVDECKQPELNKCHRNGNCINKIGDYKCECKPGYHGDGIQDCHEAERNCHEYLLKHPTAETGIYFIDPDRAGPIPSLSVICYMLPNLGITVIFNSEGSLSRIRETDPLSEERTITYEFPIDHIRPIVDESDFCYQELEFKCEGEMDLIANTAYYDVNGKQHRKWGSSQTENKCGCGELRMCSNSDDACFCNGNVTEPTYDSGKIIDKTMLPLTKIVTGGASKNGKGYLSIGALKCGPRPFDLPQDCHEAKQAFGLSRSDSTWIDVDLSGPMEPIKVFCDVTTKPFGITIVPHDKLNGNHPPTQEDNLPGPLKDPNTPVTPDGNCVAYKADPSVIQKLIENSGSCTQEVKFDCEEGAELLNRKAYLQTTSGKNLEYFGSGMDDKCACGVLGTCKSPSSKCNCDGANKGSDFGFIRKKEDLPIKCLMNKNPPSKPANSTVGPLMCAPGPFGLEPSCHEWLKRGYNTSYVYLIDPDGGNINDDSKNIDEFHVTCEMTPNPPKGVTKIPKEPLEQCEGEEKNLCKQKVKYPLTPEQIKPIIDRAAYCKQRVTYQCRVMTLLAPYKDGDKPYAYWKTYGNEDANKDKDKNFFFAGDGKRKNESKICQCGLDGSCESCFCDVSNDEMKVDDGYVTDKNVLPIGGVWIGQDKSVANLVSIIDVGDLECFENFPSCHGLAKGFKSTTEKVKRFDTFHSLDPDGPNSKEPIVAKCKGRDTIIPSEMEPIKFTSKDTNVTGPNTKCIEIKYTNLDNPADLKELTEESGFCQQYMKISCRSAAITGYVTWYDRNGVERPGWAGNTDGSKCACGEVNSCEGGKDTACNCDSLSTDTLIDHGLLVNKSILPVTKICYSLPPGKTPYRELQIQIDSMICSQKVTTLNPDCQRLRENQYQDVYRKKNPESEAWVIDPDMNGPGKPFTAYCEMNSELPVGVTTIKVISSNQKLCTESGYLATSGEVINLSYLDATQDELLNLTNVSSYCEQEVSYECQGAPLLDGTQYGAYSNNGTYLNYWLGPKDKDHCDKDSCQCNQGSEKQLIDSGKFTDKAVLPLTKIVLPDTAGQRRLCVGDLKCYNIPENCNEYKKQKRLSDQKGNRNGIWAIDPDQEGGQTYFGVRCQKKGETITTQSLQNPDPETFDSTNKDKINTDIKVPYDKTNMIQLHQLVNNSLFCSQRLDYLCTKTGSLHKNAPQISIFDGTALMMWPGADYYHANNTCACDLLNNCPASQLCRCDALVDSTQSEGGFITNRDLLPLQSLKFGTNQQVTATVYPLECGDKPFDIPQDCNGAFLQGQKIDNEVLILPSRAAEPFLVICDMTSELVKKIQISILPNNISQIPVEPSITVTYATTNISNARALVESSRFCMQPVKITCLDLGLLTSSAQFSWRDAQGNTHRYYGETNNQCQCGNDKACAANVGEPVGEVSSRHCSCDGSHGTNLTSPLADVWFVTERRHLPIEQVNFLQLGAGQVDPLNSVTVGPLMCADKSFDYDECKHGFHDCDVNANCTDLKKGYQCQCKEGWQGLGGNEVYSNGRSCIDDDECKLNKCPSVSDCVNLPGSFDCNCHTGFRKLLRQVCLDINECELNSSICDANAKCINTYGSYICQCNAGFRGSGHPGDCEAISTCGCWGDPHCLSFDGRWMHYQGKCKYTLVKDGCSNGMPDSNSETTFEIIMKNWNQNQLDARDVTWAKEIMVKTLNYTITMKLKMTVTVNGQKTTLPFVPKTPAGTPVGLEVSYYGQNVRLRTMAGLEVKWDGESRVEVTLGRSLQNKVCGLCGNYNDEPNDDWIIGPQCKPIGKQTELLNLFGDSWRSDESMGENEDLDGSCFQQLCREEPNEKPCDPDVKTKGEIECAKMKEKFKECEKAMMRMSGRSLSTYFESCVFDYCHSTGDLSQMVCDTAESLSELCLEDYKVKVEYRDNNFCKMKCGPNMRYESCASPCQKTCINTTLSHCSSICREACVCLPGFVLENGQCIESSKCGCQMSDGTYYKDKEQRTNKNCTEKCGCNKKTNQLECEKISCSTNANCGFKDDDYQCYCKIGFMGDGINCEDIDECEETPAVCDANALCRNFVGNYTCTCKDGYEGDGHSCSNINECALNKTLCVGENDPRTVECIDEEPGYKCLCKEGFMRNDKGICQDKNECNGTGNLCDRVSTDCNNTFGSYKCDCKYGFRATPTESYVCQDVNECHQVHECDQKYAKCTNTPGSYYCTCNYGYKGDGRNCSDVDECATNKVCQRPDAVCTNLPGSYECRCRTTNELGCDGDNPCTGVECEVNEVCYLGECVCDNGFDRNSTTKECQDIDECKTSKNNCAEKKGFCVNLEGSYQCDCLHGYRKNLESDICENIDECKEKTARCSKNAECVDVDGGYYCQCEMGYMGHCDECRDIDECATQLHKCHKYLATCTNVPGSHKCKCKDGYEGDGVICVDIDECSLTKHNCTQSKQTCINTNGGYECLCDSGYGMVTTSSSGSSCVDINECLLADNGCHGYADCINTDGSFMCKCKEGFEGSGKECKPKDGRELCNGKLCDFNAKCINDECRCSEGYRSTKSGCEDVNECANPGVCDLNADCINLPGSFLCNCRDGFKQRGEICLNSTIDDNQSDLCSLEGFCIDGNCYNNTCHCREGYQLNEGRCEDHRCTRHNTCPSDSICSTYNGKVECVCRTGSRMSDNYDKCIDIHECDENLDDCQDNSVCQNLIGSYKCQCVNGYDDVFGDGKVCQYLPLKNCDRPCATGQYCNDDQCMCMPGLKVETKENKTICIKETTSCQSGRCPENAICKERVYGYICECPTGFSAVGVESCTDNNECVLNTHNCSSTTEKCVNTPGSFQCECKEGHKLVNGQCQVNKQCNCGPNGLCRKDGVCLCKTGYRINGEGKCEDINECESSNDCHILSKCTNLPGSYQCKCPTNYYGDPKVRCIENKCALNTLECLPDENCANGLQGSFCVKKVCKSEEILIDSECKPANEGCVNKVCGKNAICKVLNNKPGCFCDSGYQGDGDSCVDIDECVSSSSSVSSSGEGYCPPNTFCRNTPGSFVCQCKSGFERLGNASSSTACTDIDECQIPHSCAFNANCTNLIGSYDCQCNNGYVGDGRFNCLPDSKCEKYNGCHSNAKCVRPLATMTYECRCNSGFLGDGVKECIKNNLCFENNKTRCHMNALCEEVNSTYRCICPPGFQGDGYYFCEDINECITPTKNKCSSLEKCINTPGGYICICGEGSRNINGTCEDIDECSGSGLSHCSPYSVCNNTLGSYTCKCNDGFYGDGIKCEDIDECTQGLANCSQNAMCINRPGSFDCECQAGTLGNGTDCVDEDECAKEPGKPGAANCDENAVCTNKSPGYQCECKPGFHGTGWFCAVKNPCNKPDVCAANESCTPSVDNAEAVCNCKSGYQKQQSSGQCEAVNECDLGLDNCNRTSENCKQLEPGFKCECKEGFKKVANKCEDKNECDPKSPDFAAAKCSSSSGVCVNVPGTFVCTCPSNTTQNSTSQCVPLDACKLKLDNCERTLEKCVKEEGTSGYKCHCVDGYEKVDNKCEDIDECKRSTHECRQEATCVNELGSYSCECPDNLKLDSTKKKCVDRDECSENPFICKNFSKCVNTDKSFKCECVPGYVWNGETCEDIDECLNKTHPCHEYAECSNIPGSCKCKCKPGYDGDGIYKCEERDECPADSGVSCAKGSHCVQVGSSFVCECNSAGYYQMTFGEKCVGNVCHKKCVDINECITKKGACQPNAKCINQDGDFSCECPAHLQGDGKLMCQDVNECQLANHTCDSKSSICINKDNAINPLEPYECHCLVGYHKVPGIEKCINKNECLSPTENLCGMNTECIDSDGSYQCQCSPGYKMSPSLSDNDVINCEDIDECSEKLDICGHHSKCVNVDGGYLCGCDRGYYSTSDTSCSDIDECTRNSSSCSSIHNSICVNNDGSFECVCPDGLNKEANSCEDIDECSQLEGKESLCGRKAKCVNTFGSYKCQCDPHMRTLPNGDCELINECAENLDKCQLLNGLNSTCYDLERGYTCLCPPGFINDRTNPLSCVDIDECSTGIHNCPASSTKCVDKYGSFDCECRRGYSKDTSGKCVDIDECKVANEKQSSNICGQGGKCVNSLGGYECQCSAGFELYHGSCRDINECVLDNNSNLAAKCDKNKGECINTIGSYNCICRQGYEVVNGSREHSCKDIDECSYPGTCLNGNCLNEPGSFKCLCQNGYELDSMGKCKDIDECSVAPHKCGLRRAGYCVNKEGAYECRCNQGYVNAGSSPTAPCEPYNACTNQNTTCPPNSQCETTLSQLGYHCVCKTGFQQDSLGFCRNINECLEESTCHYLAECKDIEGSFECKCKFGYQGDGIKLCKTLCQPDSCPANQHCQVTSANEIECSCKCQGKQCTEPGKVCDSDGNTHSSYKAMVEHVCEENKQSVIDYFHKCQSTCADVICPGNEKCVMSANGRPQCICDECTDDDEKLKTVCSSNDIEFASICHLKRWVCDTKHQIDVSYDGSCRRPVECHVSQWSSWSTCSRTCGVGSTSRQRTVLTAAKYNGKCNKALKETKQCSNGPCPGDVCETVSCPPAALCHAGKCMCPDCSGLTDSDPVCGLINSTTTQSVREGTYRTLCTLMHNACVLNSTFSLLHKGSCGDEVPNEPTICNVATELATITDDVTNCTSTTSILRNICAGGCGIKFPPNHHYCCRPIKSTEIKVKFSCPGNKTIFKNIKSVDKCQCKLEPDSLKSSSTKSSNEITS